VFAHRPRTSFGPRPAARRTPRRRPGNAAAEVLEDRTLLTAYVVNSLDDDSANTANGRLTLREAINAASSNATFGDAPAGSSTVADTITFADSLFASGVASVHLVFGQLTISGRLTITGPAANLLTVNGEGTPIVFQVSQFADVVMRGLTVTGSNSAPNFSSAGIVNLGTLLLTDSTVAGNHATLGGIYNSANGMLSVQNVTIAGNTNPGSRGGGMRNDGILLMSNSTVSGNSAVAEGGGIDTAAGTITLRNVTVYGNRSDSDGNGGAADGGGGIFLTGFDSKMYNTIVAGNLKGSGAGAANDIGGVIGGSNNLVADPQHTGGLNHGTNGNIVGADLPTVIDPVLRYNGGTVMTHRLLPRSVAIDSGSNTFAIAPNGTSLITDERGENFPRVRGARVDMGAFEASPADDLIGYYRGQWWVSDSVSGNSFSTNQFAAWADVAWTALKHGDFNGDGLSDVLGLFGGYWYAGLSDGRSFRTVQLGRWSNVAWSDVTTGDLNGDGKDDVLARIGGQWWAALSNGTSLGPASLWAAWATAPQRAVSLTDLDGDKKADLLFYEHGRWWGGLSNGTAFGTQTLFAAWADVSWDALGTFDSGGDHRTDIWGLYHGAWYVGRSLGTNFETKLRVQWANAAWKDPVVGDFDGDGRDDLAARVSGQWWVSLSNFFGAAGPTSLWETWPDAVWQDVRTGDFDGDGRDDIAGRFAGYWRVGRSTGSSFSSGVWGFWADVPWLAVAARNAAQVRYLASSSSLMTGETTPASQVDSGSAAPAAFSQPEREPLTLFWARGDQGEKLLQELLGAT
jgi:hypothetical protein